MSRADAADGDDEAAEACIPFTRIWVVGQERRNMKDREEEIRRFEE